jgi:Helicase associated domain
VLIDIPYIRRLLAVYHLFTMAPQSKGSKNVAQAAAVPADDSSECEVETKCTEVDVLMGRGKRVSEWPGNIFFRQVVNKYRDSYSKAYRLHKIDIAERVISEIEAIGGRFLREAQTTNYAPTAEHSVWYIVPNSRCIEKTCQALREKEKAQTTTESPFKGSKVVNQLLEQHRARDEAKRRKKLTEQAAAKRKVAMVKGILKPKQRRVNNETDATQNSDSSSSSTSTASDEDEKQASPVQVSPPKTYRRLPSSNRYSYIKSVGRISTNFQVDNMMERLLSFQDAHGHTAVPSSWPPDVVLADWCTAQRQLYREIKSGYRFERTPELTERAESGASSPGKSSADAKENGKRIAVEDEGLQQDDGIPARDVISVAQQAILDKLRSIDFCWDYDEWHWNRRYNEWLANDKVETTESKLWLRDQRQQERSGVLAPDRIEKLSRAGVYFF